MSGTNCCGHDFEAHYEQSRLPIMREVERSVLGCDYGGTSWTTRPQADAIARDLNLGPGLQHLEVGSGSGWPALYLAQTTGCDVTLVDIPPTALHLAYQRAREDGLADQCRVVAASGAALPFADSTFDTLGHSDVLCCLPEKLTMLRECRRVARSGALSSFTVIDIVPGLSSSEFARAVDAGPPFVEACADYAELIKESGWQLIKRQDVTHDHAKSLRILVDHMTLRAEEMAKAIGGDELREQKQRRQDQIAAIEQGLLRREIFLARAA